MRVEWRAIDPDDVPPFVPMGSRTQVNTRAWYVQAGWRPRVGLLLTAQYEVSTFELDSDTFTRGQSANLAQDLGVSVSWSATPHLIIRAEYHWLEADGVDFRPVPTPSGLRFDPVVDSADSGSYAILSFSTGF